MSTVLASVLPPYSPPPSVPSYSPEPAHGESTVEHTPRAHAHPTGIYLTKCGNDTIALTEQDCNAEHPTYGRHASINGFVTLEDRETVSEIVLKIKGKMDVMFSEGGSLTTRLVNDSYTVWSSDKSHASICPSAVPFSVVLPTKFQDYDGLSHPLPPSYEIPLIATPGRKFRFLTKSKTIPIRFVYNPRTRPWRPIQPSTDFLSDVKIMPEEFRQVVAQLLPRPKSTVEQIDIHLFLPMVEIFGLEDTIPFHVQLTGSVSSLREFLPKSGDGEKATIVGSLVRQIVVELGGRRATRNIVLGHAKMSPRPPGAAADAHEASLDWDGEVRCKADTMVGMFDAGCVRLQDFILVELLPLNVETCSQFVTLRHSHPIKLVTESWVDSSLSRDDPR
ncbi:hypothetical protein MVEN_01664800 [Mycena venus]|uniref:Uncharacterized protein n=1 Tax=Mycena venus TaxID=2733690 RepID=A0A8H6XRI4_9AGAR|nr:hypothetical protein MVEN_01664800 [Mycena venus]